MGRGKRTNGKPSERDLSIYERAAVRRERYAGIAQDHGVSEVRIAQIVREVNTLLVPEHIDKINEMRVEHTRVLNGLLVEAMESWEASKADKDGPNPQFLEVVRKCLADQRKIWGAEAEIIHRAPVVPEAMPPPALVMVVIDSFKDFQEYERMLEFKEVKDLVLDVKSREVDAVEQENDHGGER